MKYSFRYFTILLLFFLIGCSRVSVTEDMIVPTERIATVELYQKYVPTETLQPAIPSQVPILTSVPLPSTTSISTQAVPSPTRNPYEPYTFEYLTTREYGSGNIEIVEIMADNSYFTRYLITYPSDGLTIYGFMNIPKRVEPPFPVVIAIHGYIDPEIYTTLDYTTGNADALARAGFLVLHPNLRNYPPSSDGENLFRVGMAIDILNLVSIIKENAGQPGILEVVNPGAIGIWGHSMGGGISLRVITLSHDIKAAVLYGAMSGDEHQNFEAINRWSGGERGLEELDVPEEELDQISPICFLDQINAAVSIHHGESDNLIPIQWSLDLCDELMRIGKNTECFTYPGQPHTFNGDGQVIFNQRVIDFFNLTLIN